MADAPLPVAFLVTPDRPASPRLAALAARFGVPAFAPGDPRAPRWQLRPSADGARLELADRGGADDGGLSVTFEDLDLRPGSPSLSRRQPLARAIGRTTRTVADATAGLARDAMLLAALGFEVTAIERSPVIAALVGDALERAGGAAPLAPIAARIRLIAGDARDVLPQLRPAPDAIYVDPMFPPRRKRTALPKKAVRLLREVVGADPDAAALVDVARAVATRRVVVKRPTWADPLRADPDLGFGGKLARYDVYLRATTSI